MTWLLTMQLEAALLADAVAICSARYIGLFCTSSLANEASPSKFWAGCLRKHWFTGLEATSEKLDIWRKDSNENRPYSDLAKVILATLPKVSNVSMPSARTRNGKLSSERTTSLRNDKVNDFYTRKARIRSLGADEKNGKPLWISQDGY
jgi:hypothetical protein